MLGAMRGTERPASPPAMRSAEESKRCDDAVDDPINAAALLQRRLLQTRRCLQVALAMAFFGTALIFLLWYTGGGCALARHGRRRDATELRISYMLCCPSIYVVGVVGYGGGALLALVALALHDREASAAATAALGRTCSGCCWRTTRDGRCFCSLSAGATALAFAYVALVGLFLLALFPVRPCAQRLAPGRGWPHALGSLLFFLSGDGLLGTLLFACDDEGAYGFVRGARLKPDAAVHVPGLGDFLPEAVEKLEDPIPLVDKSAPRATLKKSDTVIYAPMADVGGMHRCASCSIWRVGPPLTASVRPTCGALRLTARPSIAAREALAACRDACGGARE